MPRAAKVVLVVSAVAAATALVIWVVWLRTNKSPSRIPPAPVESTALPMKENTEDAVLNLIADEGADYGLRIAAIGKLGRGLKPAQIEAAVKILKNPVVHETVRNDLLAKLEQQSRPMGNLGPLLVEMYDDPKQTAKWKNFCLQHLAPVWQIESSNRKQIEAALLGVLEKERGTSPEAGVMYATAMLSLSKVGASDPEITARVGKLAGERIAEGGKDPDRAVTAMHVVTAAGDKSILAEARKLAADEKALVRLRMSAMAALGQLGEASDEAILVGLLAAPEERIKNAAELNLVALRGRLAATGTTNGKTR